MNEILSDILDHVADGDWDKDIPSEIYIGKLRKEQVKGRTSQLWGKILEKHACSYLREKLKDFGWILKQGEIIAGKEFDCVGWREESKDKQSPDLAIEMHFPIPRPQQSYEFKYIRKQTDIMVRKLENITAKHKYILIGVPRNRTITVVEAPHPDVKVVYQEYRFTKTETQKKERGNEP